MMPLVARYEPFSLRGSKRLRGALFSRLQCASFPQIRSCGQSCVCVTPISSFLRGSSKILLPVFSIAQSPASGGHWPGHESFVRVGLAPAACLPRMYVAPHTCPSTSYMRFSNAAHTYMDLHTSGQFMYRPAKSMPLNASVPRACASCTPRCLNGPFIVQSPAENPEPNTVGKLEGNTILPLVGMTSSRKGKARRVFQSQPIGQTLFPSRCRCSAPSLRVRHWQKEMDPCLCIKLLVRWYFVLGSVQEGKICQHHAKMLDLNICKSASARVGYPTRGGKGAGDALRPDIQDPVAPRRPYMCTAQPESAPPTYCRSPASGSHD
ncbi:hypothetical protein CFAM422_011826 [Trichoderma lentiforme]|uniref:Uncharacterized protein n=1 Tax=Trichoderma lentiforme TaxID=1567552 RepID=A0A9P4X598_9HYPO|nr:hypothetical protein CFAM422_011826 [Trichoderma lentiforme]